MPDAEEPFSAIYRRCQSPDATTKDRAKLRQMLDRKPDGWRVIGDVLINARTKFIESMNANAASKEIVDHSCDQLRRGLTLDGDGQLEKMLVEAAVLAWLRLGIVEQEYSNALYCDNGYSFERGAFWEKRLSAAHKRFASAVVNLARVRKLLRPNVKNHLTFGQINAYLNATKDERPLTLGETLAKFATNGLRQGQDFQQKG